MSGVHFFTYLLFRTFLFIYTLFPEGLRRAVVALLFRLFLAFSSRYRRVVAVNSQISVKLSVAELINQNSHVFARFVDDLLTASKVDELWIEQNVDFAECEVPDAELLGRGGLIIAAHLGSFELIPPIFSRKVALIHSVFRPLKNPYLNRWLMQSRASGGDLINRDGAIKRMIKGLRQGKFIGILPDQNLTINNGIFVDWFSLPACTSIAPALCYVKTNCPIYFVAVRYDEATLKYRFIMRPVEIPDMAQLALSTEENMHIITSKISAVICDYIQQYPAEWFWLHKRWKTRPHGEEENLYK